MRDKVSFPRVLKIVDLCGSKAGLELNRNKTDGLGIGSDETNPQLIESGNITWPNKPILALGVYFRNDVEEVERKNWDSKLQNLKDLLQMWQKTNLNHIW